MSTVHLQFHAEKHELIELTGGWTRDRQLEALAEQFFPTYATVPFTGDSMRPSGIPLERVDRLSLSVAPLDLTASSTHEFLRRNPDCLAIAIGQRSDEGLRESAISASTEDDLALKTWRALVREARSEMHQGAVVRNPVTGAEQAVPRHLHTAGAHRLAERGTRMLAAAGWNEFLFADCSVTV